jgi:RNA polymerase primary sigma factor
MARAQQAAQKTEEKEQPAADAPERDSPLLDLSDQAVKRLLKTAKAKGYVTLDQLNSVLPSEEVSSDQIEDLYATLSDMGITVVENEDGEEASEGNEDGGEEEESRSLVAQNSALVKSETKSEPTERTDDPVRMYLREMGSVELLSREGEIAIAKRIEAGREAMIAGLCESPLTFQAIIIWRDELNEGKILLRDIIDLEATYEGPEAKDVPESAGDDAPESAPADSRPSGAPEGEGDDDDEFENAMSLAAMEAELKPKVLETFDKIAATYKKLRKQQDKKLEQQLVGDQGSRQQQKAYENIRDEIIGDVKSLSLSAMVA